MGWNSWNCWAGSVDADKVLRSARAMVSSGLANHGWSYINIDDTWQGQRGGEFKAIQGNEKFKDLKALCEQVHALGLKIGIYSTPWITSYAGFPGGSSNNENGQWDNKADTGKWVHGRFRFHENDARQWAAWGIDYLKYDWHVLDVPHVEDMATALRFCGRDIVYSLSNSAPFERAADWARLANCWRTTGDITDTWESMNGIGFSQDKWKPFGGPGHWNDPDMLIVGHVGWGPQLHPTKLAPNEQYTHISLWCLLSSPLLLGCDLEKLDDFTLNLLTNDEVLDVNQDPLGKQAGRVAVSGDLEVWAKDLEDGSKAVGLFNRGFVDDKVTVKWSDLGISGKQVVRDLWRQKEVGEFNDQFDAPVPPHGVMLVRLAPAR
jgi:alpha-galactosidase